VCWLEFDMKNSSSDSQPEELESSKKPTVRKKRRDDFKFGPTLGVGSYSTVALAYEKDSGREYAMKMLLKRHIIKEKKVPQVEREKRVLSRLDHPFFVKLFFTFQDSERLYFGLSVARHGELLSKINLLGKFNVKCTRFYTAEIVAALEHMHSLKIIHRDLKPENILFNDDMHIQITDFGTAKELDQSLSASEPQSSSFVGTAQYVSPELLNDKQICVGSDLWALGCIIFQMLTGKFPFQAPNEYLTFQQVINCRYTFPEEGFDPDAKDLIEKLLKLDPKSRLGSEQCGGYAALKSHSFFNGVDWDNITETTAPEEMLSLEDSSDDEEDLSKIVQDFEKTFIDNESATDLFEQQQSQVTEELSASDPDDISGFGLPTQMSNSDREKWLQKQSQTEWDYFAHGKLILKRGQLEKKRGLSVKLRQFLLTEGPKLLYIDPDSKVVKGEIPWSSDMKAELKSFRSFSVHTPNRTYHLIDKTNNAMKWCKKIEEVKKLYFSNKNSNEK